MGAVIGIINYNGKVLVGKKRRDSNKFLAGEWHIPGETIEDGETDEDALIRGFQEEAGLEIRVGKYLSSHTTPTSKKEAKWYECFSKTDKVIPGSDLEKVEWILKNKVLKICSKKAYSLWPKEILDYFNS